MFYMQCIHKFQLGELKGLQFKDLLRYTGVGILTTVHKIAIVFTRRLYSTR